MLPPIADFATLDDITEIEEGETVSFENQTTTYDHQTTFSWYFEGGTPMQSSQENPVILFNKAGSYSVQLKAKNDGGESIEKKEKYITVTPKPEAINEHDAADGITIYPNPTDGKLTIENGQLTIENVEIFDLMGKNVFQLSTFNSQLSTQIDISHLPVGVYFVKIKTETDVITRRVVKQ
jgi:PKD repeat protein